VFAVASVLSFASWQVVLAVVTIVLLPWWRTGAGDRRAAGGLARRGGVRGRGGEPVARTVAMTLFFGQVNLVLLRSWRRPGAA